MERILSDIEGCFFLKLKKLEDHRGSFVKTFAASVYKANNISFNSMEEYYSVSKANVFRGFHFQIPPHDHDKIVYCPQGHVMDIIVDLRKNSPSYKKHITVDLNQQEPKLVFIPSGCAHGFYTYEDDSVVVYKVTSEYAPKEDKGILWDSFGVKWPVPVDKLVISDRDRTFPSFAEFNNPF